MNRTREGVSSRFEISPRAYTICLCCAEQGSMLAAAPPTQASGVEAENR